MGVLEVLLDYLVLVGGAVHGLDCGAEFEVVGVDLVHVAGDFALVEEFGEDLDILQRLEHLELGLDFGFGIENEVAHFLEAEVMRDVTVEIIGVLADVMWIFLAGFYLIHQKLQSLVAFGDAGLG